MATETPCFLGRNGHTLHVSKQMFTKFLQHFTHVFGELGVSSRNAKLCEIPITAENIQDAIKVCTRKRIFAIGWYTFRTLSSDARLVH